MTSDELAKRVADVVAEAQERVMGVGNNQYSSGDVQRFERLSPNGVVEMLREELLDQINYAAMAIIRLDDLREHSGG